MRTTITIPFNIKKSADKKCAENYESFSGYIRRLIIEDLKKQSQGQKNALVR